MKKKYSKLININIGPELLELIHAREVISAKLYKQGSLDWFNDLLLKYITKDICNQLELIIKDYSIEQCPKYGQ